MSKGHTRREYLCVCIRNLDVEKRSLVGMGGVVAHSVQPSIPFPFSLRALASLSVRLADQSLFSLVAAAVKCLSVFISSLSLTRSCPVSLLQSTVYLIPSNLEESCVRSECFVSSLNQVCAYIQRE